MAASAFHFAEYTLRLRYGERESSQVLSMLNWKRPLFGFEVVLLANGLNVDSQLATLSATW